MRLQELVYVPISLALFIWCLTASLPAQAETVQQQTEITKTYQITADRDDGSEHYYGNTCPYYSQNGTYVLNEIYFGRCNSGKDIVAGFRFTDIEIPKGSNICTARLLFTTDRYTNELSLKIYGEDGDNPASFSTGNKPRNRLTTAASVPWVITDDWDSKGVVSSPDITPIIQEIIDRPGWQAGQALAILVHNNGSTGHRRVIAHEWEGDYLPAQLEIEAQETPCSQLDSQQHTPPTADDETFVTNVAPSLDTLIESDTTFPISMTRYYFHPNSVNNGRITFDPNGFLTAASYNEVIDNGAFPETAQLTLAIYDVDTFGSADNCAAGETIRVLVNGHPMLYTLNGQNDAWTTVTQQFSTSYLKLPQAKGSYSPPIPAINQIEIQFEGCNDGVIVAWGAIELEGAVRPIVTVPGWRDVVPNNEVDFQDDLFAFQPAYLNYALDAHLPMQTPINYGAGILPVNLTYPNLVDQILVTQEEFGVDQINLFGHSRVGAIYSPCE